MLTSGKLNSSRVRLWRNDVLEAGQSLSWKRPQGSSRFAGQQILESGRLSVSSLPSPFSSLERKEWYPQITYTELALRNEDNDSTETSKNGRKGKKGQKHGKWRFLRLTCLPCPLPTIRKLWFGVL